MSHQEEAEHLKKKRMFRKFTFRGVDLEQLLDMDRTQFSKLLHSRARRRLNRGLSKKHKSLMNVRFATLIE